MLLLYCRYKGYVLGINALRVVWVWIQGPIFVTFEFACALHCKLRIEHLIRQAKRINYANPSHRLVVSDVMSTTYLCQLTSFAIPANEPAMTAVILLNFLSALPWFWVRFSAPEA